MVQGMAFLSKKGFNPQNQVNRKQVWEAQQHAKLEKDRLRQREEQLRREREDEELCAARHNGDGSQAQLRFMYDAPPGLKKDDQKKGDGDAECTNSRDLTQIQPGDDAAAAAFRRMLASTGSSTQCPDETILGNNKELVENNGETQLKFAPVLQGSTLERDSGKPNDTRSALEKAVGRKDRGGTVTLEEQVARFPQLKNAPMAKGMSVTDVNVSFKPLGAQVRNVKCLACGVWGHSRGDRECQMTGWDPFSAARTTEITQMSSSIRPSASELRSKGDVNQYPRDDRRSSNSEDDSSCSSSSSSSADSRSKRKRKHRSKHKKEEKEPSSRKRSHKHRSRSSSRTSKSQKKKRSKRDKT